MLCSGEKGTIRPFLLPEPEAPPWGGPRQGMFQNGKNLSPLQPHSRAAFHPRSNRKKKRLWHNDPSCHLSSQHGIPIGHSLSPGPSYDLAPCYAPRKTVWECCSQGWHLGRWWAHSLCTVLQDTDHCALHKLTPNPELGEHSPAHSQPQGPTSNGSNGRLWEGGGGEEAVADSGS